MEAKRDIEKEKNGKEKDKSGCMNNKRRKQIISAINDITDVIRDILSDEQDSFDNMPESLQHSFNGERSEDAQELLDLTVDALEEAISCLEDIV